MTHTRRSVFARLAAGAAVVMSPSILSAQSPAKPASSAPKLLEKTEPEYTQEARAEGVEGTVVLRGEVSEQGKFENIEIIKTLGYGLDEKAREAVVQWVFEPARTDGSPVRVAAKIEVNFRL